MKRHKIIPTVFLFSLFLLSLLSVNLTFAGYRTDTVGDTTVQGVDITRIDISKNELKITLNEAPILNESETTFFTYNIWIDTSNEDTNPDTTTWSQDVYEYVAHFKFYYSGGQWRNDSYLRAFKYYLTSDGGTKNTGSFWWNYNTKAWQVDDPLIDFAVVSGKTITFDTTGALFREQPLGTGYVVQGVANAGADLVVEDIAPNSGWCDEFDNMCPTPGTNTTSTLPNIGFVFSIVFLGLIVSSISLIRKRKQ